MAKKKYDLVSLFCGAGGMDIGFELAGFRTVWAIDFNHDACETHRLWSGADVQEGDIAKVDINTIPDTDIITGGFPCQGFSLAGPRKVDDSRNTLYRHFVKILKIKKPRVFVAENVKGILTLGGGEVIKKIVDDFTGIGYRVSYKLLNAADYNVPQDRMRVIFVGIRNDIPGEFSFPEPSKARATLRTAIEGIKSNPEDICRDSYSSRYMSRNRKRNWDEKSFTIPAMAKQVPLHPDSPDMIKISTDVWKFGEGETRRLSYKEAAAVQTFPRNIEFFGDLTSKYKQIGNAVPVNLAKAVGEAVYDFLKETE